MLAPILVGASASSERTIQFYWRQETPDTVEGVVLNADGELIADAVPMVWPEAAQWPGQGFLSTASRVQLLLRSCHVRPVYEADRLKIVFQRVPSNGKQWEKWHELELPQRTSAYFFRLNGRVSYACSGTVFTWDPVEGRVVKTRGYPTTRVTTLAEMGDGALMVGDKEGRVHYRGRTVLLSEEGVVEQIWSLSEERCLVQTGGALIVLDCALGKEIQRFETPFKVFVTAFGSFMWQGQRYGDVKEYRWKEGRYQCSWEKSDAQIDPLSDGNLVLFEIASEPRDD